MSQSSEVLLYILIPIVGIFFLAFFIYFIKCCLSKRNQLKENQSLVKNDFLNDRRYSSMPMSNIDDSIRDVDLAEKVRKEKMVTFIQDREAALVYLQFFMLSNQDKFFKTIEHLPIIGSQLDRNWFQVKQTIIEKENNEINKYKLILIDKFETKLGHKKKFLLNIGESMSLNAEQMSQLLSDLFVSIRHPHILAFDIVEANFDQDRILLIQDYSKDGSLKDLIYDANPTNDSKLKYAKNAKKTFLPIKSIREFAKQILSAMIYLRNQMFFPLDNLHSGNIILAYKKRICLVTGFENSFFLDKGRLDIPTKTLQKLVRTYFIKTTSEKKKFRKAKNEYELKRIVEIIRFGNLILEMCCGFESENLIPQQTVFQNMNNAYDSGEIKELIGLVNYIFFNTELRNNDSDKYLKEKFSIPNLEDLYNHEFFKTVKLKDPNINPSSIGVKQIEFLQYFTGKTELKVKKKKKSSSSFYSFDSFSSIRLSTIKDDQEPLINSSTTPYVTPPTPTVASPPSEAPTPFRTPSSMPWQA